MRIRVKTNDIKIGEPLAWDLYNESGNCIFRKGFVVHTPQSLERILSIPLFFEVQEPVKSDTLHQPSSRVEPKSGVSAPQKGIKPTQIPPTFSFDHEEVSPRRRKVRYAFDAPKEEVKALIGGDIFLFLDYCVTQAKWIFDTITNKQKVELEHIETLASNMQKLFQHAPEACLGAIHLEYQHPHSSCLPVYSTILCSLIAQALGLSKSNQHSLLLAALTANLGMYEYQDRLVNMTAKLSEEERVVVQTHPELSHKMLMENGVTDSLWLNIVLQHHERRDGSGYPKGLTDEEILPEAKILATVDTYLSLVMPRAYRKPLAPKHAMQKIYQTAVADHDSLSLGLIKQLGIYPPGSLVRLASNEMGVVVARNKENSLAPEVGCIGAINGRMYSEPIFRQTVMQIYKILDAYLSEQPVEIDINQLWRQQLDFDFLTVDHGKGPSE